jgi:hypothetical protein
LKPTGVWNGKVRSAELRSSWRLVAATSFLASFRSTDLVPLAPAA